MRSQGVIFFCQRLYISILLAFSKSKADNVASHQAASEAYSSFPCFGVTYLHTLVDGNSLLCDWKGPCKHLDSRACHSGQPCPCHWATDRHSCSLCYEGFATTLCMSSVSGHGMHFPPVSFHLLSPVHCLLSPPVSCLLSVHFTKLRCNPPMASRNE